MNRLDGKNVVITGAGSGLGRALALNLAGKGCRIGIADMNAEGAAETLAMVECAGGSGEIFEIDVSKPEKVEEMAEYFFREWGGVDLLINNAGVVSVGFVGDIKLEDWQWLFGVNFWGMLYGCHSFIPRMKAQKGGHILNVSSAAGLLCMMEMAPYNTAKAGIISLSETLRWELSPEKIGVTVLCPMFFDTHLLDDMRYTDPFECDFARSTFDHARMTADEVAAKAIKAVEKNKLYCVPQGTGKLFWRIKRLSPSLFSGVMSFINTTPVARPFYMLLARFGILQ
jgi:NAD(P)-dependent dehydrogenase (short-subunit alcohol dehydrogenase family)